MARNDSDRGRKTPDHLAQMKDSTSNDGNEPSFSSDLDNSAVSTPSLADDIFSPSVSIVTDTTDIADDYGWDTPVKGKSMTRAEDRNILGSPQNETQDKIKRAEDLSKPDKGLDTQTQTTAPRRRTKSASRRDFEARTLSLGSVDISVTSFEKRKQGSDSPVDGNTLASDQGQIWGVLITPPKSKKPMHLQLIEFCTPGPDGYIDINFSTDQTWIFEARRVIDFGSAVKPTSKTVVSRTEKQDVDHILTKPTSQSIPEITLSPPDANRTDHKIGDANTPPSKNILLGDGTIQHVLSLLSNKAFSASISKKEQDSIDKSLSNILPVKIREWLEEDTHHCLALTTQNRRCKRIHETSHPKMIQYLDSMATLKSSELPKCLNDMISTALCSTTHKRMAREELEKWMVDIEKLCDIHADMKESTSVSADYRLLALANYLDILSGGKGLPPRQNIVSSSAKVEESDHSITSLGDYRLLQYFKPYIPKYLQKLSVSEALEGLLLKPLTGKKEIGDTGIIYIYWQPSNFGHLKIGYTTQAFEKRMKEWIKRCNKTMEIYYPSRDDAQKIIAVDHVYRVEKLIHLELKNLRKIEKNCPGCGKNHDEWFECSRDLAVAVVRKWMDWMRESPYEERQSGSSKEWVLKAEQRSKLKDLSEPMKGVSVSANAMEKGKNKHPRQTRRLSTGRPPRMRSKSM
ncbi:uncharacterized protein BHQ10_001868 [Talaromyces amestolkiae]|uniref:Bacteriophage T5 Orf172 DNA-binding domain-containing protein n=1 Tax=Talaromyces amestolkiae TaxID=1196081 RepID=A0A364KQN9_TALAM|nr:uncharacterized protein BHQ10_001868 [Talaromyces amestolkiae]RAO65856.1 hypothetical protein BHQ10_001868 [Talaromyces amestolkiae]